MCYHHLDSWGCLVQNSLFFLYYLLKQKQHHLCHLLTLVYLCLAFFGIRHRPLRRRVQRLREPHRKPEQNFPDFVPRIKLAKNFTKKIILKGKLSSTVATGILLDFPLLLPYPLFKATTCVRIHICKLSRLYYLLEEKQD